MGCRLGSVGRAWAWPCVHGRLLVPSAGEQGGAVSCRLRAEPPGGAATGPAEPPLGSRPLTHAWPTARNARLPFQRGEQARVRGSGVASAELLLRCGELRPRPASPPGSRWALSAHTSQRFILSLRFPSHRDSQPRGHRPPAGAPRRLSRGLPSAEQARPARGRKTDHARGLCLLPCPWSAWPSRWAFSGPSSRCPCCLPGSLAPGPPVKPEPGAPPGGTRTHPPCVVGVHRATGQGDGCGSDRPPDSACP